MLHYGLANAGSWLSFPVVFSSLGTGIKGMGKHLGNSAGEPLQIILPKTCKILASNEEHKHRNKTVNSAHTVSEFVIYLNL